MLRVYCDEYRFMAATRIIKKYPNRRLYDTEISSYITIEDVRQLILDGEDFEVRDAKSGDDLTRSVLLQIIADQEQDGEPMLSTQLLSQLIRFYGDSLQGFMGSLPGAQHAGLPRPAAAVPPADGQPAGPDPVGDDEPADRAQPGAVAGIPAQHGQRFRWPAPGRHRNGNRHRQQAGEPGTGTGGKTRR
jgi:polyhydroxyalkanoate synthesis repressor PhaR